MYGLPDDGEAGLRRLRRILLTFGGALALLIVAMIAFMSVSERGNIVADATDDVQNLRDALVEHTRQTFAALDVGLRGVALRIDTAALADPATHRELLARQEGMPSTYALFVVDAAGTLVATSRTPTPDPVDLSGRASFLKHRDDPAAGLYVSMPRKGRIGYAEDRWIVNVSRRLSNPDGSFAGFVAAALALDHLDSFYDALRVGRRGVVGLMREDGVVVVRTPVDERIVGRSMADSVLFRDLLPSAPRGVYRTTFVTDGVDRITAFARVPDLPVVVYAGVAVNDRLGVWRRRIWVDGAVGGLGLALVVGLSMALQRGISERQREAAARMERLARLNEASRSLMRCGTVDEAMAQVASLARALVPCGYAVATLRTEEGRGVRAVSAFDPDAGDGGSDDPLAGRGIEAAVLEANRPLRLTRRELAAHPAWTAAAGTAPDPGPVADDAPGVLAVPLCRDDRGSFGVIRLSARDGGEFDAEDEALLVELAFIGSGTINRLRSEAARGAALAESEAARREIEQVFASITDAVYALDRDWRFVYLNDKAESLLRRPRDGLLGAIVWEAFPDVLGTRLETEFRRCREAGVGSEFEFHYPAYNTWFDVRVFSRGDVLTVYFRDVSDAVRKEEQLRQAQKLEAIGQLTGGVAHDFNNLLTVILGNAEVLEEALPPEDDLRQLAEVVRVSAERGAELTYRLLAFARRQALDPKPTDVNRLVAGMDGLLRRTLGEHVEIELVRGAGLWQSLIDAPQLENALLNLCINARDAMPGGGRLTIETANTHLDEAYAALHDEVVRGQYVMIAVSDTGTGMQPEVAERAFEPFFTTKGAGHGSGLGLSMVYGFIKQSKGHVKIYSEPGQGTTIRMYLPRALQGEAEPGPAVERRLYRGSERILVVEDDEMVRVHVTQQLQGLGYTVVAVADGRRALDVLDRGEAFDLLFTDVVMPGGLSGRQLAEEARRRRPGLPVLFTSGYTENAIVHHGRLDPGVHLLNKPYRRADLAAKVRDVLSG